VGLEGDYTIKAGDTGYCPESSGGFMWDVKQYREVNTGHLAFFFARIKLFFLQPPVHQKGA
jgi:hypothetical protein